MTLTVLISGRGSNMVAVHKASQRGALHANISHVISNDPAAAGLEYAQRHGIKTSVLDHRNFIEREEFDRALLPLVESNNPSLILLAGFMRRLGESFVRHFEGRLLNIHPSLLPSHPGLNTHERVLGSADKWHGCSVHFVTPVLDGGPIIARSALRVLPNDTPDSLSERVLEKEHQLYWRVVQLILSGQARWRNGHVDYCGSQLIYPLTL